VGGGAKAGELPRWIGRAGCGAQVTRVEEAWRDDLVPRRPLGEALTAVGSRPVSSRGR
jgi:hypothetical protein